MRQARAPRRRRARGRRVCAEGALEALPPRRLTSSLWGSSGAMAAALGSRASSRGLCVRSRLARRAPRARRSTGAAAVAAELKAVLFDCDGVILESEDLHRRAYNAAFAHFGVQVDGQPCEWSVEYYDVLSNTVGGGKPKMRWCDPAAAARTEALPAQHAPLTRASKGVSSCSRPDLPAGTSTTTPGPPAPWSTACRRTRRSRPSSWTRCRSGRRTTTRCVRACNRRSTASAADGLRVLSSLPRRSSSGRARCRRARASCACSTRRARRA